MVTTLANTNEVIFVDDDEVELLLARRYAARSELKNPLLEFHSGEEFLAYMDRVAAGDAPMPALVLIDGRMPSMEGWEVVEELRHRKQFLDIPIAILFSNSDAQSDIDRAMEKGADHYIVKPGNGEEYVELLNSIARGEL